MQEPSNPNHPPRRIEIADEAPERRPPESGDRGEPAFRVEDRRHWTHGAEESSAEAAPPRAPALLDEYRLRAESAEQKLQEYIEAFKQFRREQDEFRERLGRDVDRRVELKFGALLQELLETLDDIDLALEHAGDVPQAAPLARGLELARKRFLEALERHGVQQFAPGGEFDPNEAEAVRVDAVSDPSRAGAVTQVLRSGYRLGERVIRPARVAVGRLEPAS